MDKGYYAVARIVRPGAILVAIHNKNGQGLLQHPHIKLNNISAIVAIHNKNGQGLLRGVENWNLWQESQSQSTIKMDKGYYMNKELLNQMVQDSRNPQ